MSNKPKQIKATVTCDGSVIKVGLVARKTTSGAFVWDPRDRADAPDKAEWFPFRSLHTQTVLS
jgi:hypothetical protein